MSTSNPATITPGHIYGLNFPEHNINNHPGFLLVGRLAEGSFGIALLVLSLADHELYVKKVQINAQLTTTEAIESPEYSAPYSEQLGGMITAMGVKTTTTWQFCNGGTLQDASGYILSATVESMQTAGYPDVEQRVPEAFIWRFFDAILSVLTTANTQSLVHFDLHGGNIFLHWPTLDSLLPDILLGDWGCANTYPWSQHPDPQQKGPFQINDLARLDEYPAIPSLVGPMHFPRDEVTKWYSMYRSDLRDLNEHMWTLIGSGGPVYRAEDMIEAANNLHCVNGYTYALIKAFADLDSLVTRNRTNFQPLNSLAAQKQLQARVHRWAKATEMEFRDSAHPERNFMRAFRKPLPDKTPATWPTSVVNSGTPGSHVVWHEALCPSITLDEWIYEVRRIRQRGDGNWELVDEEVLSDASDLPPSDGKNGNGDDDGGAPLPQPEEMEM